MIILRSKSFSVNTSVSYDDQLICVANSKGKSSRQSKRKGHVSRKDHKKSRTGRDPNNPKDIADAVNSENPEDKEWIEDIDKKELTAPLDKQSGEGKH